MSEVEKRRKRCCFTGHRPEKLKCDEATIKSALSCGIDAAIQDGYRTFISGMARGVDIWAAELVLERRVFDVSLHLICALPYLGFEQTWSKDWQVRYRTILRRADLVKAINPSFSRVVFQRRNEWMVDHSNRLIAVYNGSSGGTRNTIAYAKREKLEIVICEPMGTQLVKQINLTDCGDGGTMGRL